MYDSSGINAAVPPSGPGCVECSADGGWWFHLRRCAECGHIGCCDSSPRQHASGEPGEDWFWDYRTASVFTGPELAPPLSHPQSQSVPGPAGKIPPGWRSQLH